MRVVNSFMVLLAFVSVSFTQSVTVSASVDSQSVTIGDWIRYTVDIQHSSTVDVTIPSLKDSIGSFEIVQQDSIVKTELNGETALSKKFILSKYEAGNFYLQPFIVQYRDADGKIGTAESNPIPVEIRGIEVDTTQTIKDLKPPLTVPMSIEEIAVYLGICIALAGLVYGVYYYNKKRKRTVGDLDQEKKPKIPPHILALMQLEELEAKNLWQSGEIKMYYSEATEIIRRYFELRYGIMALEMTTGEVMMQLEKFTMEKNTIDGIESLLSGADLVKFAKYQPIASENEQVISQAREIVEKTKPMPTESETTSDGGTDSVHPNMVMNA